MHAPILRTGFIALALGLSSTVAALPFSSVVVFGDSLSDTGNVSILLDNVVSPPGPNLTPLPLPAVDPSNPFDDPSTANDFVPSAPYLRGGGLAPAFSDGPVWAEQLAAGLGLSIVPSLANASAYGSSYAFGSALAGAAPAPGGLNLLDQIGSFIAAVDVSPGADADPNALYVVFAGGNDARAATLAPASAAALIAAYADGLSGAISALVAEGARHILVPNLPDIGKTPAVETLGALASAATTGLVSSFNTAYSLTLGGLETALSIDLIEVDLFALLQAVHVNPTAYGLSDVDNACAASIACALAPGTHLFWDGIHPTSAGHALLATAALRAVPAPATILLVGFGLALFGIAGAHRASARSATVGSTRTVARSGDGRGSHRE